MLFFFAFFFSSLSVINDQYIKLLAITFRQSSSFLSNGSRDGPAKIILGFLLSFALLFSPPDKYARSIDRAISSVSSVKAVNMYISLLFSGKSSLAREKNS